MNRFVPKIAALLLAGTAFPAYAQVAAVSTDLNLRVGPGTAYPVVRTIPGGGEVRVFGCLNDYDWCDVGWSGTRGWVSSDYLRYRIEGAWYNGPQYIVQVGYPVITFTYGDYVYDHYRNHQRWAYYRDWGRDHHQGDRHADDRHERDRDGDHARRGDGDRYDGRRDRGGDRNAVYRDRNGDNVDRNTRTGSIVPDGDRARDDGRSRHDNGVRAGEQRGNGPKNGQKNAEVRNGPKIKKKQNGKPVEIEKKID